MQGSTTGKWMLLAVVLLAGCSESPATGPWGPVDPDLAATFEAELEEARAEQNLPGLAMAIAYRDTREIWISATGFSNLADQTEWSAADHSRIGSVTKTFTTAVILQLYEEGMLSLEDPIETWVPGWYEGPTLRHLLSNTSGIVSYNYVGSFDVSRPWTPQELVQWAWDNEPVLRFAPGTEWEYSNTNFVLLGMVIEAATGQSYGDVLQARLFGPEGLGDTRLALSGDSDPRLVHSYSGTPPVDNTDVADPSFGWAAGAIASTPEDLAHWVVRLYGGDVLAPDTLELMTTPSGVTAPGQEDYGLGVFIENDSEHTLVGHTGGIGGYTTYAYYLDDPAVAVIIMSNWQETDLRAASMYGWAAVLGIEYP